MLTNEWRKAIKSNPSGNCVEVKFASASKSNGNGGNNCVEVTFHTATKSGPNSDNCVEVSTASHEHQNCGCDKVVDSKTGKAIPLAKAGNVLVRDSKDKTGVGPILVFTPEQWQQVLLEVDEEGMDWSQNANGMYVLTDPEDGYNQLFFDKDEWDAFLDGVRKNEFVTKE